MPDKQSMTEPKLLSRPGCRQNLGLIMRHFVSETFVFLQMLWVAMFIITETRTGKNAMRLSI